MNATAFRLARATTVLAALLAFSDRGRAEEWKLAPAPLVTRWAHDVSPEHARPEYPRPDLARTEWRSLNGIWEFAFDDENVGRSEHWWHQKPLPQRILVPFSFEAALSGIGKGREVHERVWYRHRFTVPMNWNGKRIILHFGAVDWEAGVWVNGHAVGEHRGGYVPFAFDITDALKAGENEVVVAAYDPADPKKGAFQPKGKQLGSHGIWYTRTTGIWQSVWLEPVPRSHIEGLTFSSDIERRQLHIQVQVANPPERGDIRAAISVEGKRVAEAREEVRGKKLVTISATIPNPLLWSPETPALYDIDLSLEPATGDPDAVRAYTAFRDVRIKDNRICLNGKPYFLRGVLDQGFWPDGIYTAPSDEAIRNDVSLTKAFGFNLARKHVKVEDPRWYYYCDRMGLLVAQDMPSSHNLRTEAARRTFSREWREVIATIRNHPSIILWIPFNENWGDPKEFQDQVVDETRAADGTRPVIDASGWTQRAKTDITDIHDYGNDLKKHSTKRLERARWIGEYGGIALPVAGHTWVKGWGYQVVRTPEELLAKYRFLTDQINGAPGLSGFVYTQLTDVEQELNGVMTYDRIPKAPPERFAEINRGK